MSALQPARLPGGLRALCLAALLLGPAAHAASEAAIEDAYRQFHAASRGEAGATERAAEAFAALLQAEPANPWVMAYAGASTAMQAGTTLLPWKKMGYAEDGLALIDKALALLAPAHESARMHNTPVALEVRYVAASSFLAVPGFMNRGARGSKLLAEVLASPQLATAPLGFRGTVWLRAGRLAQAEQRPAEARRWFETVVQSGAPQADAARARLQEIAP